eukprot:Pgem_evm1s19721
MSKQFLTIGIMGAMFEEIDTITSLLDSNHGIVKHEIGQRIYSEGMINKHKIIVVHSRWGKVASSTTAACLIHHFKVEKIIFSGVAGSLSSDVNIGDIVIADNLYQHDMDGRPLVPRFEIPLTGKKFFTPDQNLKESAIKTSEQLTKSISKRNNHLHTNTDDISVGPDIFAINNGLISMQVLQEFNITEPKVVIGKIATGDSFVSSVEQTQNLLKGQPNAIACDMESAAIAQICEDYNVPFCIVRTISDNADHQAHIDFPNFVNSIASCYSKVIVKGMID